MQSLGSNWPSNNENAWQHRHSDGKGSEMHFEHEHQFVSFWRGLFSISRRRALAASSICLSFSLQMLTNRQSRLMAYRQFVCWVRKGQPLGKKYRVTLPTCVVKTIMEEFPSPLSKWISVDIKIIGQACLQGSKLKNHIFRFCAFWGSLGTFFKHYLCKLQ
jgi:hypothetical protein